MTEATKETESTKFAKALWRQVVTEEEWRQMVWAVQHGYAAPPFIVEKSKERIELR